METQGARNDHDDFNDDDLDEILRELEGSDEEEFVDDVEDRHLRHFHLRDRLVGTGYPGTGDGHIHHGIMVADNNVILTRLEIFLTPDR
jgi:hypothetical protein